MTILCKPHTLIGTQTVSAAAGLKRQSVKPSNVLSVLTGVERNIKH